jgi:hypothetical protein
VIALIDGDLLVYRIGASVEPRFYKIYLKGEEEYGYINKIKLKKEAEKWVLEQGLELDDVTFELAKEVEPFGHALSNLRSTMDAIISGSEADRYRVFITGSGNFRETLATSFTYKGNRDRSERPFYYEKLREVLCTDWLAEVVDGIEADDAMAMNQWADYDSHALVNKEEDCQTIICSLDKDLNMIPGWHYDWVKDKRYYIDDDTALYNFFIQLCTGDNNDNIIGISGVGPVRAKSIVSEAMGDGTSVVKNAEAIFRVIQSEYAKAGIEDRLEENADLLWMLRTKDTTWRDFIHGQ